MRFAGGPDGANGAIGTIGTSRIGTGRKMGLTYEIQGIKGALFFTQERMNELKLYRHTDRPGRARLQDPVPRARISRLRRLPPDPGQRARLQRPEDHRGARADLRDRRRPPRRARLRLRPQDHPGDRRGAEVGRGAPLGADRGGVSRLFRAEGDRGVLKRALARACCKPDARSDIKVRCTASTAGRFGPSSPIRRPPTSGGATSRACCGRLARSSRKRPDRACRCC